MSTTLDHAKDTAKDAFGSAKEAIDSAKGSAEHAASNARSSFLDFAKFAVSVFSTVRGFSSDDALGLIGLARRRSALSDLPAFGAGVVVGAGVGLLFAPMSGTALRRTLLRSLNDLKQEAGDKLEQAGDEVKAVERKVEKKASDVADAVKGKVEAAEESVKETIAEGKSAISSKTSSAGNNHGEGTKTSKTQGGAESGRSAS